MPARLHASRDGTPSAISWRARAMATARAVFFTADSLTPSRSLAPRCPPTPRWLTTTRAPFVSLPALSIAYVRGHADPDQPNDQDHHHQQWRHDRPRTTRPCSWLW